MNKDCGRRLLRNSAVISVREKRRKNTKKATDGQRLSYQASLMNSIGWDSS